MRNDIALIGHGPGSLEGKTVHEQGKSVEDSPVDQRLSGSDGRRPSVRRSHRRHAARGASSHGGRIHETIDVVETSPSRGRLVNAIRRAPLASFLVLACLLSWWPAVLYAAGVSPVPIAGFGPFLAAVVVLAMTTGRTGINQLLRSMVNWRVPFRSYLAAIGLPLAVSGTAILANLALGAALPQQAELALWMSIPFTMLAVLLIPGIGGAWEEPGFRGLALGRLDQRFGLLAGPLVLGGFHVFWHLPLFLVGQILWIDVLVIVAASVVIAAVFHSARDSVLIAMLLHATNNAVGGGFASQLFHGTDEVSLGLLTAALWWLLAGGVMLRVWRSRRAGIVAFGAKDEHRHA